METAFEGALETVRSHVVSPEEAADGLYAQLTDEERLGLLDGDVDIEPGMRAMSEAYNAEPIVAGAVPRLGIPGIRFTDGPRGVVMGNSTCFPVSIARAASWDVELERDIGRAIGIEARAQGANLFAGVCINLLRHPRWGRAQESYGEDPVVLGQFGAALTRGVRENVMACVKHYALNSIENSRFFVDVQVEEDALHEVYLPHFRQVVDAGADAVMSAYNKVNGEWAGHNSVLLTEILRDEWGFSGFVMSDFIRGIRSGKASLEAGMDLEMPFRYLRGQELPEELASGRLGPDVVRSACNRILAAQLRHLAGLNEDAPTAAIVTSDEHRALARRAATQGMVLLRNERVSNAPVLPLDVASTRSIAVLGSRLDAPNIGDHGSSAVRPPSVVTPIAGIRAGFPGADVRAYDGEDPKRAAEIAARADVAIVVAGFGPEDEGEARDRASLSLLDRDEVLITAVAAANDRTIVAVVCGGPPVIESWRKAVPAILIMWYPGMEGGGALADVLSGAAEPRGRLPAAVPNDASHLSAFDNQAESLLYDRWWGQRKLDRDGHAASYPFGFGLGYATFELRDLVVEAVSEPDPASREHGSLTARVTVANTSDRDGGAVLQLYALDNDPATGDRAHRQLLGFAAVDVHAGKAIEVQLHGSLQPLAGRDAATGAWSFTPGSYHVEAAQFWGDPKSVRAPIRLDPLAPQE
jgi:beta-glucosidase